MAVSLTVLRPRLEDRDDEDVLEFSAPEAGAALCPHEAPLLAVGGICGGAGTTTLCYLLARYAVRELDGHVLVCDSGSSGGLTACAGVRSARSLSEAADELARGLPRAGGLYALDESARVQRRELRVIATGPRYGRDRNTGAIPALLSLARHGSGHVLVVVDCGTLQQAAEREVLRAASHIAWVLPATRSGARRADEVLAALPDAAGAVELIVARSQPDEPAAPLKVMKTLAERRQATLVLLPRVSDPLKKAARAGRESELSLQAICSVLQR
jgi:hypothetical protein